MIPGCSIGDSLLSSVLSVSYETANPHARDALGPWTVLVQAQQHVQAERLTSMAGIHYAQVVRVKSNGENTENAEKHATETRRHTAKLFLLSLGFPPRPA